jgi:hypothetical protein
MSNDNVNKSEGIESQSVVLMIRNQNSGFLEEELAVYALENDSFIVKFFAEENDGILSVHMFLSTEPSRIFEDDVFEYVYDYYDDGRILTEVNSFVEVDDVVNPTWEIIFPWERDDNAMTEKINRILELHRAELAEVYDLLPK